MKTFPKNPFPGMNPWLEEHWSDVHTAMTLYARDAIDQALPPGLQARVEEYLSVEGPIEDDSLRRVSPDVTVYDSRTTGTVFSAKGVAVLDGMEPIVIRRTSEPMTLRYLEILDVKAARKVITAIEFAGPANKSDLGAIQYRRKQQHLLQSGVNLVEIDLFRRGEWIMAANQSYYPRSLTHPYRICVTRAVDPDQSEVYRASFEKPLPNVRIPLRSTDEDIRLPLQEILNQAYIKGRYGDSVDYDLPPSGPLSAEDQACIATILSTASAHG